ncbi:MAG: fibronectin type III domain-containing protein [Candidatus Zambryskibacteria bacterium]|nr:fibronectin type III domain-containing protein [Candidatus Zambryskibacteria bacterium]
MSGIKKIFLFASLGALMLVFAVVAEGQVSGTVSLSVPDGNLGCPNEKQALRSTPVETTGAYLDYGWMGGDVSYDDWIEFYMTYHGPGGGSYKTSAIQPAGSWGDGCINGSAGSAVYTKPPLNTPPVQISGTTAQGESFDFNITVRNRQNPSQHGSVEYGYTLITCKPGQFVQSGACVDTAGTITVAPGNSGQTGGSSLTCAAPCNPDIHWRTTTGLRAGADAQILRDGTQVGPIWYDGDYYDSNANLAAGPHTYTLQIKDGFGNWSSRATANVAVSSPQVSKTATLAVSTGNINLSPSALIGSATISNVDATNEGRFTVTCEITSNPSNIPLTIVCPTVSIGPGASGPLSAIIGSGAPTDPSIYIANVRITADGGSYNTTVSGSPKNVFVNYSVSSRTATLSVSPTKVDLSPNTPSATITVSNSATNEGTFTIDCTKQSGTLDSRFISVSGCSGSVGSDDKTFFISVDASAPSGSSIVQVRATGQNSTSISGSPQNVTINYVASNANLSLTANPSRIDSGQNSTLFWVIPSDEKTPCAIRKGYTSFTAGDLVRTVSSTGSGSVSTGALTETTSYQLSCPDRATSTNLYSFTNTTVTVSGSSQTPLPNQIVLKVATDSKTWTKNLSGNAPLDGVDMQVYFNSGYINSYYIKSMTLDCGNGNNYFYYSSLVDSSPFANLCSYSSPGTYTARVTGYYGYSANTSYNPLYTDTATVTVTLNVTKPVDFSFNQAAWTIPSGTPRYRVDYDYNNDGVLNKIDQDQLQLWSSSRTCPISGKTCDINGRDGFSVGDVLAYNFYLQTLDIYQNQNDAIGAVYLQSTSGATVAFTASSVLGTTFSPNPLNISANGKANATMTVPRSVSVGSYSITITGTASGVSKQPDNSLILNVLGPPLPPTQNPPTAGCDVSSSKITLTWTPSQSGSQPTGYDVYLVRESRSIFLTRTRYTKLNSTTLSGTTLSYTHSNLSPGTLYTYVIQASNPAGTSGYSNRQSATASSCATPINYNLSNSGTSNVAKVSGYAHTQNIITKTLVSGDTQQVDLSLSGVPSGTTYTISNVACLPTCSSTITFAVDWNTRTGTYPITVTGSPLDRRTAFNLVVSGNPMTVTCTPSSGTALINRPVTWTANVSSGGTAPFTYSWSGTNIPTNPAPTSNPYTRSYSTVGQKNALVRVTDADGLTANCATSTVFINFNPAFQEF